MGVLRLGFISVYLSDQLVQGLTTAAAVEVFTNQMPLLFGIKNLPKTSRPLGIIKVRQKFSNDFRRKIFCFSFFSKKFQFYFVLYVFLCEFEQISVLFQFYIAFFQNITDANWVTIVMSIGCLTVLILYRELFAQRFKKKFKFPLPVELLLVKLQIFDFIRQKYLE